MRFEGHIDLPAHLGPGGFDHAAVHTTRSLMYVAHTANSSIDVIDVQANRYLQSIPNLAGVAGALVSEERDLVFTSNRGEDTVGIFHPEKPEEIVKLGVCSRPNGVAFDPSKNLLLVAGVGEPYSLTVIDVASLQVVATIPSPGRTRWTVFDSTSGLFYVNVGDPAVILVIDAADPIAVQRTIRIPAKGPHGLDIDSRSGLLFCACDEGKLFTVRASTGEIFEEAELSGVPDVLWFNAKLNRLYVAIGDPGVVDVFDASKLAKRETVTTERGAHTTAFDSKTNRIYAFLPETSRASVYSDFQ